MNRSYPALVALSLVACGGTLHEDPILSPPDSDAGQMGDADAAGDADAISTPDVGDNEDGAAPNACPLPAGVGARWIAFDSDGSGTNRDIYLVRADGSQRVQLTTDPTTEKEPAFSSDGKSLAFTSDRSGSMQIHIMDLASKNVRQLTSINGGADEPAWSADGSQIVFHSNNAIYTIDADGSGMPIARTDMGYAVIGASNTYGYPVFTPSGTTIVCDQGNEIDAIAADGFAADGGGITQVVLNAATMIETPSLSADGLKVAFAIVREPSEEQIAFAPVASSTDGYTAQTVTAPSFGSARRPAWGPGNVIAYELDDTPSRQSWKLVDASIALSPAPNATPCVLAASPGDNRNPAWAPEGYRPQ